MFGRPGFAIYSVLPFTIYIICDESIAFSKSGFIFILCNIWDLVRTGGFGWTNRRKRNHAKNMEISNCLRSDLVILCLGLETQAASNVRVWCIGFLNPAI